MMRLARYTLTEKVHEGKDAIICRGYRDSDRLQVGVKLLKSEYPDTRQVAKLRHEFLLIKELSLEGVVTALSLEKCGHSVALVMRDFGGRPLNDVIQSQQIPLEEALQIAASLAHTIAAMHRRHIIHKDIKPHNILVDMSRGAVKLIDFGIATRLSQESPKPESPGALEGTLAYMAPEQTGRMNRIVDHRADLYSLGVTTYEMLTGVLPFRTTDPIELVHSHIARTPVAPHEISPGVPEVVSQIVMKLLSKPAEDRYQGAEGLARDLDECLRSFAASGAIAPFPLGEHDTVSGLLLPQKLYGREEDVAALFAAWERVIQGTAELLLVTGYSGVGKSTLVNEIHKAIARQRGYFIAGKCDQLSRSAPYAAIVGALRELVRAILTERAEELLEWKSRLLSAIGANGQVLIDLIPELALVIGAQPAVPDLGPAEAQNRFTLVFQSFLRVIATADRPLVLFLDDLQWADAASLMLLQVLLTDPTGRYLLLIGAYRDNEVDAGHPLLETIHSVRGAGARVSEIRVKPLSLSHVVELLDDMLGCGAEPVAQLAELVFKKTGGNPFFLTQFLLTLYEDKLLWRDASRMRWCWDLRRIEDETVTENVVHFIEQKLRRLAPTAQHALRLAACIGHQFDLQTLSILREVALSRAADELWEPLQEGAILPLDPEYRLMDGKRAEGDDGPAAVLDFNVSYRFLHDRVQQAAYSLIDEGQRTAVHLRIGRLMLAASGHAPRDAELFNVVDHLNLGAPLLTDAGDRLDLARLNLTAGRKANASTAYHAAAGYLRTGISMLDERSWESAYDLSFAMRAELAQCEYLTGALDRAEAMFDTLVSRARSNLDRALVVAQRIVLLNTRGKFIEAVNVGRATLSLFGVHLPLVEEERRAALEAQLAAVHEAVAGRRIEDLIHLPELTDPEKQIVLKLLTHLDAPVYQTSPELYPLLTATSIGVSLRYGHSELSAYGYMAYGFGLSAFHGRHAEALAFGKLALALNEKFKNTYLTCKLHFLFASYVHFCKPIREVFEHLSIAFRTGLTAGDFNALSYACIVDIAARMGMGEELSLVRERTERNLALMQQTKDALTTSFLLVAKQVTANLQGLTRDRGTLSDDTFDEAEVAATLEGAGMPFVLCWYRKLKAELLFLYGDHEGALWMAEQAASVSASCSGLYFTTELTFYTCLALAAVCSTKTGEARARLTARLARHQAEIARLAESCPQNYRHVHQLVSAEIARLSGEHEEAAALYDDAIESARQSGFLHHDALANELCARFYASKGRQRIARTYLTEAYHGYVRWGAAAKASDLAEKNPQLISPLIEPSGGPFGPAGLSLTSLTTTHSSTTTGGVQGEQIDAAAVVRSAQAIAQEIVLDKVLERVMQIVLASAGAQRGFLILARDEHLVIEASIQVEPDKVQVGLSTPVEKSSALAVSVVQYVARTSEPVILGDAASDGRFGGDRYVTAHRPRSILCLAMMHQGRLTGVLYLENNVATGVFTPSRIELIRMLSSQAAIAVENALLYGQVKAVTEELWRANEALETEVAHRTEELREAYGRLEIELDERVRNEQERAALQEEIISAQNARLLELSTPFIPITDRIMVMPLIGTMDARRAQQVLETALQGVQANAAKVVIIDITGVKRVDATVAATLMSTAAALRLLGVKAVLTGIRPEVARTLVGLDIDLLGLVTMGTLKSGITYALGQSGEGGLNRRAGRATPSAPHAPDRAGRG